jgi:hypothetical protein
VGPLTKELSVVGDRAVTKSATGAIVFSEPRAFEKVPLRYDVAYGGVDEVAEAKHGNAYKALHPYMPPRLRSPHHSPFRYPRNGIGKGYVIEDDVRALEALALPNLEDPTDPLTPARLFAGSHKRWPLMPLPWCTDWASLGSFTRYVYLGGCPAYEGVEGEFPEVRRKLMVTGYPKRDVTPGQHFHARALNAGSLGLQIGPLTGEGIAFELSGMHAKHRSFTFRLPAGAPKIAVDGRSGKLVPTKAVLHHVVIEPDHDRVSVLWRGSAPAYRAYTLEELEEMPLSVEW